MHKPKTLVNCPPDAYFLHVLDPIRGRAELMIGNEPEFVREHASDAEVILISGMTGRALTLREIWPLAKRVRWVHSLSAGVENLLFSELIESPVPVTNARGVFKRSLAEFAVLGVLYFYKQVRRLVESQRRGKWDQFLVEWMPGRTMGIVGYGEIGRECGLLAKGLGMRIVATRRRPDWAANDPILDKAFRLDDLRSMLAECDVVVLAAPSTPETFHIIGEAELRSMKKSAILVNVGRGVLVDEPQLIRALQEGWIAAAALDVFEKEPLPDGHPFWTMENVLLSPHCTDRTKYPDWLVLTAQQFVDNFERYLKGEPLQHAVDKKAGY
jgi:phosphoglycerate dehydrogenase-like enzyme